MIKKNQRNHAEARLMNHVHAEHQPLSDRHTHREKERRGVFTEGAARLIIFGIPGGLC